MPRSTMLTVRRLLLAGALLFATGVPAWTRTVAQERVGIGGAGGGADGATVVFLVRHAEKADDGTADPPLTEAGRARVGTLTRVLGDSRITRIHTTDYARTRATAGPVAEALGLTVEAYDPGDLEALAREIRRSGGRHLVVGHSNTTPGMVELLGGDPGSPIDEAQEHDRLYVVTLDPKGTATTVVLRYGRP